MVKGKIKFYDDDLGIVIKENKDNFILITRMGDRLETMTLPNNKEVETLLDEYINTSGDEVVDIITELINYSININYILLD